MLEDFQANPPPPVAAPTPVVTEDALVAILLPYLRQQSREDFQVAAEALHEGITKALGAYQDQLSAKVWKQLMPVLGFAHQFQQHMDNLGFGGAGQTSNQE